MRATDRERLRLVEEWLERLYIASEGATLRREERQKAVELAALLLEIERGGRALRPRAPVFCSSMPRPARAMSGSSPPGWCSSRMGRPAEIVTLERDPRRCELGRRAAARLDSAIPIEFREADVADARAWPDDPSLVTALHACGPAADAVIERAVASRARALLLVPCCTGRAVDAAARAERRADAEGIPRHAPVRRRFVQAWVDAERTWRLEAAGYETEVVEFVAPTVTPHNLLWRARRVGEPGRMRAARRTLERWME